MELPSPAELCEIVKTTKFPVVFKNANRWPLSKWSLEDWISKMPTEPLPFRFKPSKFTLEPNWEGNCKTKLLPLKTFLEKAENNPQQWGYFDYKYVHQWLKPDNDIYKQIKWDYVGFDGRDATETTMWIGSNGAHTPCHQDTYGRNIVLQAFGKKRWLLFPPESRDLQPTRIPYEESSIYSRLNFATPANLDGFKKLSGCRMVTLEPGDTLVVPPKWWHYVEHVSSVGISFNTWIPCENTDTDSRIEEALIRLLVGQLCKDLPEELLLQILNPNEEDVVDLPLTVSILQVDTTVKKYLDYRSKKSGAKRLKLDTSEAVENPCSVDKSKSQVDIDKVIKENSSIIVLQEITNEELISALENNVENDIQVVSNGSDDENVEEVKSNKDHLTSAIINSFCHPDVIKLVKNKLLQNLK